MTVGLTSSFPADRYLLLDALAVLWETAYGQRGSGLVRGPAMAAVLLVLLLAVGLSPLWLVLSVVVLWRTHTRHRHVRRSPTLPVCRWGVR